MRTRNKIVKIRNNATSQAIMLHVFAGMYAVNMVVKDRGMEVLCKDRRTASKVFNKFCETQRINV